MAAIGINVSTKDAVSGWESIKPEPMSRLQVAYNDARENAENAWDWYYQAVDQWEDTRTRFPNNDRLIQSAFDSMVNSRRSAEQAEIAKGKAYFQLHCPHVNRELYGQIEICEDCGARF